MSKNKKCVYFTRHGQTFWNVEDKICGSTDIALTEYGQEQAIALGQKILEEGLQIDEILYSPLIRAADTARHISEITGISNRRTASERAEILENTKVLHQEMHRSFRKQKQILSAAMRAVRRCCISAREFTTCWTTLKSGTMERHICWWRTMVFQE